MTATARAVRALARPRRGYCAPVFSPPGFTQFGRTSAREGQPPPPRQGAPFFNPFGDVVDGDAGGDADAGASIGMAMVRQKRAREAAARDAAAARRAEDDVPDIDVDLDDPAELVWYHGGGAQASLMHPYLTVLPNYITREEAVELEDVIDAHLESAAWESAHIDALIRSYRERYVDRHDAAHPALTRLREYLTGQFEFPLAEFYHFLEYKPEGYVKPHLDNPSESAHFIAGLSLSDTRAMTLTYDGQPSIEMVLPPRSLYVLRGPARYEWMHSIDFKPGRHIHDSPRVYYKSGAVRGLVRGTRRCVVIRGQPVDKNKKED